MNWKNLSLALIVLVIILAGSTTYFALYHPQKSLTRVTLLTNFAFNGRDVPFFVGIDQGFYQDAGLLVSVAPGQGSGLTITSVKGGAAQYGMADSATTVNFASKGSGVVGFMVYMDSSPDGVICTSPISSPADVIGKTIGATAGDSIYTELPAVFAAQHLSTSGVKYVTLSSSVLDSSLLQGQVDCISSAVDVGLVNLQNLAPTRQFYYLVWSEWGLPTIGYFLVTSTSYLNSNAAQVKAFAAATAKAVQYSVNNPEQAAQIMEKYNPTMNETITLDQWKVSSQLINDNFTKANGYGVTTTARLNALIPSVVQALNLTTTPTPDQVFQMGYVQSPIMNLVIAPQLMAGTSLRLDYRNI